MDELCSQQGAGKDTRASGFSPPPSIEGAGSEPERFYSSMACQAPTSTSSTAPENHIDHLWPVSFLSTTRPMNPINYGYEFPCEFEFVPWNLTPRPHEIEEWTRHQTRKNETEEEHKDQDHFLRKDNSPLTAIDLYRRLAEERIENETHHEPDRRLIYITDLDCHTLVALAVSNPGNSNNNLVSLFRGNISLANPQGFQGFRLNFHLPFIKKRPSSTATALLALSSGILISSSSTWLNKRMELFESSAVMNKILNAVTHPIPNYLSNIITRTPDGIIFVFFLLGAAGLTGTTITWLRNSQKLNRFAIAVGVTLLIASWIVGFSADELVLVCLPLIISCSIACSCVFGQKNAQQQEHETVNWLNEV